MDDELRQEIAVHLESRTRTLVDEGMDPREAAREARRQFGNVTAITEHARDVRGFPLLDSIAQDVAYGIRLLWRAPLFTLVAVLSIGFGLASALAIFTVANAVLLRPFVPGGEDIHRVYTGNRNGSRFGATSFADYTDFATASAFAGSCIADSVRANMSVGTSAAVREGGVVSGGCFDLFRLRPHLGRALASSSADEAVISYALWHRQFLPIRRRLAPRSC